MSAHEFRLGMLLVMMLCTFFVSYDCRVSLELLANQRRPTLVPDIAKDRCSAWTKVALTSPISQQRRHGKAWSKLYLPNLDEYDWPQALCSHAF